MASPSPSTSPAAPLPVIKLIPRPEDDDSDSDDGLPPVASNNQPVNEEDVPSWTIVDFEDDGNGAAAADGSDEEEGEVDDDEIDEYNDPEDDNDDDAASDWGGDDGETLDGPPQEELGGTFNMPDLEDNESDNERAGMGDDAEGEAEEADAGSDTEEMVRLIDADGAKSELADYHPMVIVPTDDEVAAMAMVVRDAKGEIIDEKHSNTFPWITRFERARVIGTRAAQLSHGAPPQINVPDGLIDSMKIAEIELENGQIPFIIRRPLPDGAFEYWPVNELQVL